MHTHTHTNTYKLRLTRDFQVLVFLIQTTMKTVCWALVLLLIIVYAFGLVLVQAVADYQRKVESGIYLFLRSQRSDFLTCLIRGPSKNSGFAWGSWVWQGLLVFRGTPRVPMTFNAFLAFPGIPQYLILYDFSGIFWISQDFQRFPE